MLDDRPQLCGSPCPPSDLQPGHTRAAAPAVCADRRSSILVFFGRPPPPPPGLKFHQIGLKRRPLQPIAELLRECLQRFCLRGASFHRVVVPRRFDHEQVLYTSVFFARSDSGPLRVYRQSSRQALDMAGASSEVGLHRFEARFLRCMRRGHLEILGASALAGPRRGFALFVGACARLGGGVSGWGGRRRSRPGALAGLRGGAWPMRGSTGMTENG